MSPFAVKCKQPVVTCIDRIWQILTACFLRSTHCDRGKLGQALGLQLEAESPTGIWEMRRRSDGSDGRSRCLYALQCEMPRWYQGRRHPRHGAAYRNLSKMHCVLHLFTGRWDSERPESTDASFQEGASYISTIWRLYPMFAGRSTIVYLHLSSFIHLKNTWIWVYIISHYNCKSRKSPFFIATAWVSYHDSLPGWEGRKGCLKGVVQIMKVQFSFSGLFGAFWHSFRMKGSGPK